MSERVLLCTDVVEAVAQPDEMTIDELVDVLADVHSVFEPVARSAATETLMNGYIYECSDGTVARTGIHDGRSGFMQA